MARRLFSSSEADERYRTMIADAEERSRTLLADTDEKVRKMIFEAENKAVRPPVLEPSDERNPANHLNLHRESSYY